MRTKWIFAVIMFFIVTMLTGTGFLLYRNDPIPFWIIQGMAMVAVLFSVFIYKILIKPYDLLINGMQLLKEQDFTTHLHPVGNKEANQLIHIFNRMITHLRTERLAVREKNQFLDLLLKASPQGIIILDFNKTISEINPAAMKILRIPDPLQIRGKTLKEADFELSSSLATLKPGDDKIIRGSGISAYHCLYSSFIDQGFDHPFLLIEELTQELLNVEKKAYERIVRMMSHEVNNSVGAISSTLSVVSDIFTSEEKEEWKDVLPAVNASFDRCGHLAQFISKLAQVVRVPEPSYSMISLNEQVRSVYALTFIECQRRRIDLKLELSVKDPLVRVDGIQIEQVLVNIIKNAYEAINEDGTIRIITSDHPVSIIIEDDGPGITGEDQQKLFTPLFTTKPSGQGIGLMFVRDVLINHGCRFNLGTENGLTRFSIFFE